MSIKISLLLDGQLHAADVESVLEDAAGDAKLRDSYTIYGLIGDALRGNSTPDDGYSKRIMDRITREDVRPVSGFDPLKDS